MAALATVEEQIFLKTALLLQPGVQSGQIAWGIAKHSESKNQRGGRSRSQRLWRNLGAGKQGFLPPMVLEMTIVADGVVMWEYRSEGVSQAAHPSLIISGLLQKASKREGTFYLISATCPSSQSPFFLLEPSKPQAASLPRAARLNTTFSSVVDAFPFLSL